MLKTGRHDWYRHKVWNEEIEAFYEAKLKRARGTWNKMQCLSIQAGALMYHGFDNQAKEKGVELAKRLINDYAETTEYYTYLLEQVYSLGDFYDREGQPEKAIVYFQQIVNFFYDQSKNPDLERPTNIQDADLRLADIFIRTEQIAELEKLFKRIDQDTFWKKGEGMFFNFPSTKYYYPRTMAFICSKIGKLERSKSYAELALNVVGNSKEHEFISSNIASMKIKQGDIMKLESLISKA